MDGPRGVDGPHCVYPSYVDGHQDCFHLSAVVNHAAVNTGVQISLRAPALNSFGYVRWSGIAGSYGDSMFNFLSNLQAVFHGSCTLLHSLQLSTRLPKISLHPHQSLSFLFFFLHSHPKGHEV